MSKGVLQKKRNLGKQRVCMYVDSWSPPDPKTVDGQEEHSTTLDGIRSQLDLMIVSASSLHLLKATGPVSLL